MSMIQSAARAGCELILCQHSSGITEIQLAIALIYPYTLLSDFFFLIFFFYLAR